MAVVLHPDTWTLNVLADAAHAAVHNQLRAELLKRAEAVIDEVVDKVVKDLDLTVQAWMPADLGRKLIEVCVRREAKV